MPPTPIDLLHQGSKASDRIRTYYRPQDAAKHSSPVSENTALLCGLLFTAFYILPFYLSSTLRTSAITSRDAPHVIRARVRAVGLTCLTCTLVDVYVLTIHGHASPREVLRLTGIWPSHLSDVLRVLLLVIVLFTCSLYESIIVDGDWRTWSLGALKKSIWDSWPGYRNLIVAPVSEELVFRALTIPLFLLADTSPTRIVFTTPLIFGFAHLHHLVGFIQVRTPTGQRIPPLGVIIQGLVISLFQFAYTSLFGFFAAFVFLRTGNLWAIIVAHSFCNHMGFPRLWGRVGQQVQHAVPSPATKTDDRSNGFPVSDGDLLKQNAQGDGVAGNLSIGWTVAYYSLVVLGSYSFYRLLFPLTESGNALAKF